MSTTKEQKGKDGKKPERKFVSTVIHASIVVGIAMLAYPAYKTIVLSGDPIQYMLPNFLLLTGYRELTIQLWERFYVQPPLKTVPHQHVPILEAKDYTWEAFREATNDWRSPAVVRGHFLDVPAIKKWGAPGYLSRSALKDFEIPIIKAGDYGTYQNDRYVEKFGKACDEVVNSPTDDPSKLYIFFPVKSRFNTAGADEGSHDALVAAVEKLTRDDLHFDSKIRQGFGAPTHKTYKGAQMIIGWGTNDTDATTGTGWHCAPGSNFFIQVVGRKRWFFLDPKLSSGLKPLRGGMVNMMTGFGPESDFSALHTHLDLRIADLIPGDMLYNPDWQWHTIQNYEGLSIGCPIREANLTLSLRNNLLYTSAILGNKIREKFGWSVPGLLEEIIHAPAPK